MRARLLRSSLLAAAVAVLLVGLPLMLLGAWQLDRLTREDLVGRAEEVQLVVGARPGGSLDTLRDEVAAVLRSSRWGTDMQVLVRTPDGTLDLGPRTSGATLDHTTVEGATSVRVALPRSVRDGEVLRLGLVVLSLSVIAFVAAVLVGLAAARRLISPLAALADNADRVGRGEARLLPVHSGVAELDRVAAGLQRSAESLAVALAAERDFASDASHQLRTPLTALSMRLEEISASEDPTQVQEEARIALNQVERLTSVVDSLLTRARRTRRETLVPVDLLAMLVEQVEEWSPAFHGQSRRLVLRPHEPVNVLATPSALSQVLATLIENSLEHGDGTATITARRTGGSVVVEVTDEGVGVPRHLGPRVFERTVSSSGSTGLGLALARDLAEADGGRLELLRTRPPVFALFLNAEEQPV